MSWTTTAAVNPCRSVGVIGKANGCVWTGVFGWTWHQGRHKGNSAAKQRLVQNCDALDLRIDPSSRGQLELRSRLARDARQQRDSFCVECHQHLR